MMLSKVTKGIINDPPLVLIYGTDGVGKSTFAAGAPNPIFIGSERGTNRLNVSRVATNTWEEIMQVLKEILEADHDYKTLVVDSLDWAEPLLWRYICQNNLPKPCKTIERADGGYGKGYIRAAEIWRDEFIDLINRIRDKRKMNVILIAHADVNTFQDPQEQVAYQRYELKLHKRSGPIFREYVDAVMFMNFETFTKAAEGSGVISTYSDGTRKIYTERRPSFDAKNRFGLPFEFEMTMNGWNDFMSYVEQGSPESTASIKAEIDHLLKQVEDEELKNKALETIEKAGNNLAQLTAIAKRLSVITEKE